MRSVFVSAALASGLLIVAALRAMAASPPVTIERHPGDGEGAFKTHRYHDLFAEQLGRSRVESHAKVESAFRQLFQGDGQEQRIYFETGTNADGTLAYITDWANNDARTEGMSYGMMIAVQLDKKREFVRCGTGPRRTC